MKLDLRTLPTKKSLKGLRILIRVDWNIPISSKTSDDSLKLRRTIPTIKALQRRGAKLIVLTHIGRPKKRESALSTKKLVPMLKRKHHLDVIYHPESVSKQKEWKLLSRRIEEAEDGSIHLLENVRFEKGEIKNDKTLAKQYASLGDLFVNDAFASCHRKHTSVVGIAREFKKQAYAGPALVEEVKELSYILKSPKKPFVAVIGGKKLSTKIPFIEALLKSCDQVLIGGAMATPFYRAEGYGIGQSFYEKEALAYARRLLRHKKKIGLPQDIMTVTALRTSSKPRRTLLDGVAKNETIVDVGPATLADWAKIIGKAKTIVWNGPVGIAEFPRMGFGSRFLARLIASRTCHGAWTLAGGGDTLPVLTEARVEDDFHFVSTGGGAMLEFVATKGLLPGIQPLLK